MRVKSITKSCSMERMDQFKINQLSKDFDKDIDAFCNPQNKDPWAEPLMVSDIQVTVSQDGTSNWTGGVHNVVMNAIITYR